MKGTREKGLLLAFAIAAILLAVGGMYRADAALSNEDFIRFHVIANSDSPEDQALKMKVRDHVIDIVNEDLICEAVTLSNGEDGTYKLDIENARKAIKENIKLIQKEAERVIKEEGFSYPVDVELGVSWIPQKRYGNIIFPEGSYEALKIKIGTGNGQNWWCVLFPPLCLIGGEYEEEMDSQEVVTDLLLNSKYNELMDSNQKKHILKLKFKTLEMIS